MTNRWARFRWPARFQSDPRAMGEQAGLVVRADGDAYKVTTAEQYSRRSPARLLAVEQVVREQGRDDTRCRTTLRNWRGAVEPGDAWQGRVEAEVRRLLHLDDGGSPEPDEYFEAAHLVFASLPDDQLPDWVVGSLLPTLAASTPDYRVCLISYSDRIHYRMAWIRAVFSGDHASEWFAATDGSESLGAARGLAGDGFQGTSRLIDPLLGAHAPWLFGVSLPRIRSGMALVLFGRVLAGRRRMVDSELIDFLSTNHLSGGVPVRSPATPTILPDQAEAAVRWWVQHLNVFIGQVLDPTLFTDKDGWYEPHQHFGYLLSVERLFASIVSLLGHSGRDEYTRRMHLFESLDLLEGLSLGGYDRTVDPKKIGEHLAQLEDVLPAEVAEVVLPRCRAAAQALHSFRNDFHPGRLTEDGRIRVVNKNGSDGLIGKDKATTQYLRLVRNAGHSLRDELEDPFSRSLIASHEGNLPSEVSDLPYLHLLRLIAEPNLVSRPLLRRREKASS